MYTVHCYDVQCTLATMNDVQQTESVRVVLITFPNHETARQIGTQMVESQLAACVNLVPSVISIYRWQGAVEQETEVLGVVKTVDEKLSGLEKFIEQEHPYDVSEFLVLKPETGSPAYLSWIVKETLN